MPTLLSEERTYSLPRFQPPAADESIYPEPLSQFDSDDLREFVEKLGATTQEKADFSFMLSSVIDEIRRVEQMKATYDRMAAVAQALRRAA
jgi:hypothetical protein